MLGPLLKFEIFDDVAAFWFVLTLLAVIVVPRAIWLYLDHRRNKSYGLETADGGVPCQCGDCVGKRRLLFAASERERKRWWFSLKNVLWVLAAVGFLYMVVQIPSMGGQKMAVFNPYDILGLTPGSTNTEIKKAYRRLVLDYHPDKNPSEEAQHKFIQIAKAYEILTDEAAKEKWDKYGTSDGYQGVSVTIGLPSFLLKKENEKVVLLVYLGAMVLLYMLVTVWWSTAGLYNEHGVMHKTMEVFAWHLIHKSTVQMHFKYLVKVLSTAFELHQVCPPEGHGLTSQYEREALRKLGNQVNAELGEGLTQVKFDVEGRCTKRNPALRDRFVDKVALLLHAHLMRRRMNIDPVFAPDLMFILGRAHKLVEEMAEHCKELQMIRVMGTNVIKRPLWQGPAKPMLPQLDAMMSLCQRLTQALWDNDSELLQLPHMDEVRKTFSRHATTIRKLRELVRAKDPKLERDMQKLSSGERRDIESVLEYLPDVSMECAWDIEGEEDKTVQEGDLLTLRVSLKRNNAYKSPDTPLIEAKPTAEESIAEDDPDNLLWKGFNPDKQRRIERDRRLRLAPPVHAPLFPTLKREKWYLFLVDYGRDRKKKGGNEEGALLHIERITSLLDYDTYEIKVWVPPGEGVRSYELVLRSDCYVGLDVTTPFTFTVTKGTAVTEEQRKALADAEAEDDQAAAAGAEEGENKEEGNAEEEELPGKWYFLGAGSFQELAINAVLIVMVSMFLFNFLYSRGWIFTFQRWWAAYLGPYLDPLFAPMLAVLRKYLGDFSAPAEEDVGSPDDAYNTD